MNGMKLAGKIVVVSGSSGPLGAAIAETLATAGVRIIAADMNEPPTVLPNRARFHKLDVTSQASWTTLAESLRLSHGEVHGFVNTVCSPIPTAFATSDSMTGTARSR